MGKMTDDEGEHGEKTEEKGQLKYRPVEKSPVQPSYYTNITGKCRGYQRNILSQQIAKIEYIAEALSRFAIA
jgi:hypothetical protein